jgi:hypothetical protein
MSRRCALLRSQPAVLLMSASVQSMYMQCLLKVLAVTAATPPADTKDDRRRGGTLTCPPHPLPHPCVHLFCSANALFCAYFSCLLLSLSLLFAGFFMVELYVFSKLVVSRVHVTCTCHVYVSRALELSLCARPQ